VAPVEPKMRLADVSCRRGQDESRSATRSPAIHLWLGNIRTSPGVGPSGKGSPGRWKRWNFRGIASDARGVSVSHRSHGSTVVAQAPGKGGGGGPGRHTRGRCRHNGLRIPSRTAELRRTSVTDPERGLIMVEGRRLPGARAGVFGFSVRAMRVKKGPLPKDGRRCPVSSVSLAGRGAADSSGRTAKGE